MFRSATFAPVVRLGYIPPNYILCLAEAGFTLEQFSMKIKCVECSVAHDIRTVRNDPSESEYHNDGCRFIKVSLTSEIIIKNLDYSFLIGRLHSFKGYKLPYPLDALDLATNYIYRADPGLCFVCYLCNAKIRPTNNYEQLANYIKERRPIGCLCRQRTQSLSNVSVIHPESSDIDEDHTLSPAITQQQTQESEPNQEVYSTHNLARQPDTFFNLGRHQLAFPNFILLENRIQSFFELTRNANNIPVKQLAEQGAFYIGDNKMCCCYCGLQFPLSDDPASKHKEKNSTCKFMKT